MNDVLLRVGSPTVTYSGVSSCWLVDTGALVPIAVPGRRLAFEIAASYVPPAGDPLTHLGEQIATPGVAGSTRPYAASAADGEDPRRPSHPVTVPADRDGFVPGPAASPRHIAGPGTTKTFHGCEGEVGAPAFVGVGAPTGSHST